MPPPGEGDQPAEGVQIEAAVQEHGAGQLMPARPHVRTRSLLRVHGDEAERVVGQVHRDVQSDDDARDGAQPGMGHLWESHGWAGYHGASAGSPDAQALT